MLSLSAFLWKVGLIMAVLAPLPFILNAVQKQNNEDWSSVLETLAHNIEKRQAAIKMIRSKQEHFTKLLIQYGLCFWITYATLWHLGVLPTGYNREIQNFSKATQAIPLVFEPILFAVLLVVIRSWYARKGVAEENNLRSLLKQRQATLAELKEKSNFHATYDLLQRYSDDRAPESHRHGKGLPVAPTSARNSQPPTRATSARPSNVQAITKPPATPTDAPPPTTIPFPSQRKWYDRVADLILGEDAGAFDSSINKFALICEKCCSHNGLVKEAVFDDLPFRCRTCTYMNPSYKSKMEKAEPSLIPGPLEVSTATTPSDASSSAASVQAGEATAD